MPTIQQLSELAQTAQAAYAIGLVAGASNATAYQDAITAGMSAAQATAFNAAWLVVEQSTATANGFSAVLLQNRTTGEKVLAIAGTDPASPADLITDLVNIALYGTVLGMPQYQSLASFYTQLVSSGRLGATEQITVTGHSLGGFLAQAFTARHASVVSAAYTYNAPGFGSIETLLGFLGITDTGAAAKITNVHATDGLSMTAGLGVMLGASQPVRIEGDANPLNNHSVVTLGDALAVHDLYARLQPSINVAQAGTLFAASGHGDRRQEGALDALRTVFVGSASNDVNKTPTGDRDRLYSNLYALLGNAGFQAASGQVQLRASNPAFARQALGATDTALAYRYALLELQPFAVVGNSDAVNATLYGTYTARLSLYDDATGQGSLSKPWMAERSGMLEWLGLRNARNIDGVITGAAAGRTIVESLNYQDLGSGTQILVGATDQLSQRRQVVFGGDAGDTLLGYGRGDALFGGGGDDALQGQGGNDHLEGNIGADLLDGGGGTDVLSGGAGDDSLDGGFGNDTLNGGEDFDTYTFSGAFGSDSIEDEGGAGSIVVTGLGSLTASNARKTSPTSSTWQSDDKRITYSVVQLDTTHQNLVITVAANAADTNAGSITVRNWVDNQLGIHLGTDVVAPATTNTYAGDYTKATNAAGTAYLTTANGYVSAGPSADALDLINGTSGDDLLQGLGGNDGIAGGNGSDVIEGGAGDDLLLGGTGYDTLTGGAGNDFIFGSALGSIARPTAVDFAPPVADGLELARGFSWVAYRNPGNRINGDVGTLLIPQVAGADLLHAVESNGLFYTEASGNIIDGGAGNDFISAGAGADVVHGGADNDDIIGLDGGDVLFGDAGDDFIWGDGLSDPARFTARDHTYIPASQHGNDLLVGGAGNDILVGQGGDDELYGGSEDDQLWGDDDDAEDTPVAIHGDDYLYGGDGADKLVGGGKDDQLFGGIGNDRLWGDDSDTVVPLADQGVDYLDGEYGDDQLTGGGNDDVLIGGAGNDTMQGDDVQSKVGTASHGDDYLDGGDGDDLMAGGGGDDEMLGGAGNDQLQGDDIGINVAAAAHGMDFLDGGAGNDSLIGGGNADNLFGGEGDDILQGDDITANVAASAHGDDYLDGGAGNDRLWGQGGNDTLSGGEGADLLNGDDDEGQVALQFHGADTLDGGAGDDQLYGAGGDDQLSGGDGKDYLDGGTGADVLDGGAGQDTLLGGAGNDTLVSDGVDYLDGGAGDDTYLIKLDAASSVISIVNDSQGVNTLQIAQGPGDVGSYQLFSQGGATLLRVGGLGVVALGPQVVLGDTLVQAGGQAISLQQVALSEDAGGRVHSRILTSDGLVSTATANFAQSLKGGGVADALDGGSGNDALDGGAGDDELSGGAGDDTLYGGEGADIIIGGTGNDTLAGGNPQGRGDASSDTYVFNLGDGADRISAPALAGDGVARDVISFGTGITAETLQFTRGQSNLASGYADLVIAYSTLDAVTLSPGAFSEIVEIRFADGSRLGRDDVLRILGADAQASGDQMDIRGGFSNNTLIGGALADRLYGYEGDDVLVGGAGNDLLIGGTGRNTYVFAADSGADQIQPASETWRALEADRLQEQGVLQFTDATLADLKVTVNENDLLVTQASGAVVRVRDFAFLPTLANWQIIDRNGAQSTLGTLLASQTAAPATLAERRQQFIDTQLAELATLSQRSIDIGDPQYPRQSWGLSIPTRVDQAARQIAAGSTFAYRNYLDPSAKVQTTTKYVNQPVYQSTTVTLPGQPARFVALASLESGPLPAGALPVYQYGAPTDPSDRGSPGTQTLVGYYFPQTAASTSTTQTVVGWQSTAVTNSVVFGDDRATQAIVTGTLGADTVVPAGSTFGLPTLFRGTIDTGAGDDVVALNSGNNGINARTWTRYEEWVSASSDSGVVGAMYERGLGAWVDLGAGNDRVSGSDGNDFIIGGAGSDVMDGQAGADTYYIGHTDSDVDHIADLAFLLHPSPSRREDFPYEVGVIGPFNEDAVEFDAGIALGELTYRWIDSPVPFLPTPDADVQAVGTRTLELFRNGQRFLDIDYLNFGNNSSLRTGIEQFRFSDGQTLSLDTLFGTLSEQALANPTLRAVINSAQALTGQPLSIAAGSHFTDPHGDKLRFTATLADGSALPQFLSIDPATGTISGQARRVNVGGYQVRVQAINTGGLTADAVFDLNVALGGNSVPELVQPLTAPLNLHQGDTFSWQVPAGTFFDDDPADALSLSARRADGTALPAWLSFDAQTGTLTGRPAVGDLTTYRLAITATDPAGAAVIAAIDLNIVAGVDDQVFIGTDADDAYFAGVGNDLLIGAGGNDNLFGYLGNDHIDGGPGDDSMQGGDGDDTLMGSSGSDWLQGDAGNDYLNGGAGSDTLFGGLGNDSFVLDDALDQAIEALGEGNDTVEASISYTAADNIEDVRLIGNADIDATGNGGTNRLTGNAGNNRLDGAAGADTLVGGAGDDVYLVGDAADVVTELAAEGRDTVRAAVTWALGAHTEDLVLEGSAAIDGSGNALDNVIVGNEAANTLAGGAGDDQYYVGAGDTVNEAINAGIDTVWSSVTLTLRANIENLTLLGTAAINATGNTLANVLVGNSANNTLNGAAGADTLRGGAGNDIYVVDNVGDVVTELAGEGTDRVNASIGYTLGAELENLTLTGSAAINGAGNALNNVLTGNSANNTLIGGDGNDSLSGGAGDDVLRGGTGDDAYVVDSTSDLVIELADEGLDSVQAAVSWTLSDNVENVTLTGTVANSATGNALNNVLTGNSANNTLIGGAGDDTLNGGTGDDTLLGGVGNDTYVVNVATDAVTEFANEGTDTVQSSATYTLGDNIESLTLTGGTVINGTGNAADNILIGNGAANILTGGAGDDTYIVGAGDAVTEAANGGTDRVQAGVTWTLSADIENLTLTGTNAINGTGNASANVITGNSAANGLNGAAGADTLIGGAGSDTYTVDDAGDVVIELANEGTDLIKSSVSYALGAEVENLTFTGSAAINGTGNALNNVLTGNSGANALTGGDGNDTLDGGAGNDTMLGGSGDDIYVVNSAGDVTIENASEGVDTVRSSVTRTLGIELENLTLTGTGALNGTGNALNNLLTGNSSNNTLSGLAGDDIYVGGAGNDTLTDSSTTSNDVYRWGIGQGNDTINDAGGGADRIEIAAGVTSSQVTLTRSGNNLLLGISGAADVLTVANWYVGTANKIEEIRLADGMVIGAGAAPLSLVNLSDTSGRMRLLADPTLSAAMPDEAAMLSSAQSLVQAMAQFGARGGADQPWVPRVHYDHQPMLMIP